MLCPGEGKKAERHCSMLSRGKSVKNQGFRAGQKPVLEGFHAWPRRDFFRDPRPLEKNSFCPKDNSFGGCDILDSYYHTHLTNLRNKSIPLTTMIVLPLLLLVPQAMAATTSTFSWQVTCQHSLAGIPGSAVARMDLDPRRQERIRRLGRVRLEQPRNRHNTSRCERGNRLFVCSDQILLPHNFHNTVIHTGIRPEDHSQGKLPRAAYGFPVSIKATFTLS